MEKVYKADYQKISDLKSVGRSTWDDSDLCTFISDHTWGLWVLCG